MKKFTQKIAKDIAQDQLNWTIGCLLGTDDPDYNLDTDVSEFEQNFEERLEEIGINPTPKRLESIVKHYNKMTLQIKHYLNSKIKTVSF